MTSNIDMQDGRTNTGVSEDSLRMVSATAINDEPISDEELRLMPLTDSSGSRGSRPSCSCSWTPPANVTPPPTTSCSPALPDWARPRWR